MTKRPFLTKLSMSPETINEIVADYERENPGLDGWSMPFKEFSDRFMKKLKASAEVIEGGNS